MGCCHQHPKGHQGRKQKGTGWLLGWLSLATFPQLTEEKEQEIKMCWEGAAATAQELAVKPAK